MHGNIYVFIFGIYKYIKMIKESGKSKKFDEAIDAKEFLILRHDVEFSVERAFKMACIENDYSICSTYFFQITNNTYNLFSKKNISMVKDICSMGHDVGLHFQINGINDLEQMKDQIKLEMDVLSRMLCSSVDKFSFHRPSALVLANNIKIENVYNAYQDDFFICCKPRRKS